MDITSLYTVIPNNEGLQALRFFFDQRTIKEPSSETLLRLAELVLTLNCFSFADNAGFNSTCYHPPPGTPPGICNFFLTWRSIPHPRASRKRQFPTPGTPHRPQIRCFVFKIDFRTIGQPNVLTRT